MKSAGKKKETAPACVAHAQTDVSSFKAPFHAKK